MTFPFYKYGIIEHLLRRLWKILGHYNLRKEFIWIVFSVFGYGIGKLSDSGLFVVIRLWSQLGILLGIISLMLWSWKDGEWRK